MAVLLLVALVALVVAVQVLDLTTRHLLRVRLTQAAAVAVVLKLRLIQMVLQVAQA
jgi:hypothetical protein